MTFDIYDSVNQVYVDITPFIAFQGVKWQRNDIDAPDAGRGIDGYMYRNRVGTKYRVDVTCKPLTLAEASVVLKLIKPQFIYVRYTDPEAGGVVERLMYSNNIPATFCLRKTNGEELWSGITFPLVER